MKYFLKNFMAAGGLILGIAILAGSIRQGLALPMSAEGFGGLLCLLIEGALAVVLIKRVLKILKKKGKETK